MIISPKIEEDKPLNCQIWELFTQSVSFSGRHTVLGFELFAEVIDGVETAGGADFVDGMDAICKQVVGHLKAMLNQDFEWGGIHKAFEATSHLAAAYIGGASEVVEGNRFAVVGVDEVEHLLQPDLVDELNAVLFIPREALEV